MRPTTRVPVTALVHLALRHERLSTAELLRLAAALIDVQQVELAHRLVTKASVDVMIQRRHGDQTP